MDIIKALAEELNIGRHQAEAAVKLIDEGNTIPFIARYPGILQLNKPIMRYRPNKACFFNVKFFVLYYSILWYFL